MFIPTYIKRVISFVILFKINSLNGGGRNYDKFRRFSGHSR